MNTSKQAIDNSLFMGFTPLCDLDTRILDKLARHATIQSIAAGNFLFERGDTTQRTFYLLEGDIELCSPLFPTQTVSANTPAGRYPLAHSFPRQFTAVTVSNVRVMMLPLDISEVMQTDAADAKTASASASAPSWEVRWLESPMLRRLTTSHKKSLLSSMEEIKVQAGQVVIHQDEPADSYYVIKNGRCSVSRKPAPGARDVKLAELAEGQGFGEEALITNVPRNATVSMLSDGILLRLGKQQFIEQLAKPLLYHLPFQHAIKLVEQGAVLVDVRTPEEFEIDGLIGSLNMPIPVLRLKANRLNRDRTYIVYSNTGQTSSVAVFLMLQQGLNACVLEGGLHTAPKHRMKRGGFGEQEGQSDDASSSNTILPFPNNASAKTSHSAEPTQRQKQQEVDWNHVSDDVLWRTTLGYRKDAGVEAVLAAKPSQTVDTTMQGFDDIRLFTKINTLQNANLTTDHEPRDRFSGTDPSASFRPTNPAGAAYDQLPHWSNKTSGGIWQRFIFAIVMMVVLLGGGLGFFYFTNGKLPINLEAAPPLLLEQQRNLDAKVNRLLDVLESMPALQGRTKDSKETSTPAVALPPTQNDKNDSSTGNTH